MSVLSFECLDESRLLIRDVTDLRQMIQIAQREDFPETDPK